MTVRIRHAAVMAGVAAVVAACATTQPEENVVSVPPNAGVYKIGNPYEIEGTWYYPREQPDYDETGVASWYGPPFNGRRTANGESYDASSLTAAHRTLPMPVNVRVTNLENGKSLIVRVNDRGPFSKGRIIDVSERAAKLLGFYSNGTARVRVTFVARGNLPNGQPQPSETPVEVATALPAVPTGAVDVTPLGGSGSLPPSESTPRPERHPAAPPTSIDELAATQPTGQVTTVPVPTTTHLYVQVGAFSIYSDARRIRERLGQNLQISTIERNGQKLYRVRMGPFEQVADADRALALLADRGSNDARIVVDR
ncbi:MAG: septal ring lytic transglycosylase RlpA family protein [Alphaproteobacteria bacterium]|nr:septal ring lytic transglycosylase RlpA family protein [Alphaproteobacteria bacterium]